MMRISKLFNLALMMLSFGLSAATIEGKVVNVADGDTITVLVKNNNQYKIRLQGIDAPEKAQPDGKKSTQSLHQLVHSRKVIVEYQKKDKYGRIIGKVLLNGTDICLKQIELGMAWHYKKYESEQSHQDREIYTKAEQLAQVERLGIWNDKVPTAPWEFRKLNK
jgi:endonuclease YncB( thermonuclease family)